MKRVLLIAIAMAVVLTMSVPAWAATNPNAVITLHAKVHGTKGTCTTASPNNGTPIPCTNYVTNWPTNTATDVYLVVARGDPIPGLAGMSCGVQYSGNALDGGSDGIGVDVFGWQICADLEFTNGSDPLNPATEWPVTGGGNRITWVSTTNCQRTVAGDQGVHAVAGVFYMFAYGPDIFYLTENKNLGIPELAVASCAAATDQLPWGRAAFLTFSASGTELGCNPCTEPDVDCTPTAVERSTWGRIKTTYGSR